MEFVIAFEYKDMFTQGKWRKQYCNIHAHDKDEAIEKCKNFYGLDRDCDYRINRVTCNGFLLPV